MSSKTERTIVHSQQAIYYSKGGGILCAYDVSYSLALWKSHNNLVRESATLVHSTATSLLTVALTLMAKPKCQNMKKEPRMQRRANAKKTHWKTPQSVLMTADNISLLQAIHNSMIELKSNDLIFDKR